MNRGYVECFSPRNQKRFPRKRAFRGGIAPSPQIPHHTYHSPNFTTSLPPATTDPGK